LRTPHGWTGLVPRLGERGGERGHALYLSPSRWSRWSPTQLQGKPILQPAYLRDYSTNGERSQVTLDSLARGSHAD